MQRSARMSSVMDGMAVDTDESGGPFAVGDSDSTPVAVAYLP